MDGSVHRVHVCGSQTSLEQADKLPVDELVCLERIGRHDSDVAALVENGLLWFVGVVDYLESAVNTIRLGREEDRNAVIGLSGLEVLPFVGKTSKRLEVCV